MFVRSACGLVAAAFALAPAAAQAASVAVDRRCVAEGERATFTARALTPGAHVRLALSRDGRPLVDVAGPMADPSGSLRWVYGFPRRTRWFDSGETQFRMTAKVGDATTTFRFARRDVRVDAPGGQLGPDRPATIHADGFASQTGKPLYAHWLRAGRRVKTVRLGRLSGTCGRLTRRLPRGFPFRPVDPGTWHVAFNTSATNPRVGGTVVHRAARVTYRIP